MTHGDYYEYPRLKAGMNFHGRIYYTRMISY